MAEDLVIIGSGPAGLAAAVEAARAGVKVTVVDENASPGGQLFKQIHKFFGSEEHQAGIRGIDIGYRLLEECHLAKVKVMLNTAAWGIFHSSGNATTVAIKNKNDSLCSLDTKVVLLATGARENPLAFPGWTLPGVMGAGAAQTLINLHRIRPGNRVLMIGSGNVGLIVSYQLKQAGADIAAVIDIKPEIGGWGVHAAKLTRTGIPILCSHKIIEVRGLDKVEEAHVARVDREAKSIPGSEKLFEVDTVCIAVGLSPMTELAWSGGCRFAYLPELGGHVPVHNRSMETTRNNIYIAGDISGIEEASTAMEEGKIAGISIARSLGLLKNECAEELIRNKEKNLSALRGGPMGKTRKLAKEKLIRLFNIC